MRLILIVVGLCVLSACSDQRIKREELDQAVMEQLYLDNTSGCLARAIEPVSDEFSTELKEAMALMNIKGSLQRENLLLAEKKLVLILDSHPAANPNELAHAYRLNAYLQNLLGDKAESRRMLKRTLSLAPAISCRSEAKALHGLMMPGEGFQLFGVVEDASHLKNYTERYLRVDEYVTYSDLERVAIYNLLLGNNVQAGIYISLVKSQYEDMGVAPSVDVLAGEYLANVSMLELDLAKKSLQEYEYFYGDEKNNLDIQLSLKALDEAIAVRTAGKGNWFPLFKIAPAYPKEALDAKVEGYCLIGYEILAQGNTDSIELLECVMDKPGFENSFAKNSIAAVKMFRYSPRYVDGVAVSIKDVRNKFTFKISK